MRTGAFPQARSISTAVAHGILCMLRGERPPGVGFEVRLESPSFYPGPQGGDMEFLVEPKGIDRTEGSGVRP
jgi:hypothetical protein